MIYDFKCTKCEEIFEVKCKLDERENTHPCPKCESEETERHWATTAHGKHSSWARWSGIVEGRASHHHHTDAIRDRHKRR